MTDKDNSSSGMKFVASKYEFDPWNCHGATSSIKAGHLGKDVKKH